MGCDIGKTALKFPLNFISIHAARVGCDLGRSGDALAHRHFNPRSPSGLRPHRQMVTEHETVISIHAARVGCDIQIMENMKMYMISIHAARVGCDKTSFWVYKTWFEFQSTQPEWAATAQYALKNICAGISIHAARVGCDFLVHRKELCRQIISIHAARVGCDHSDLYGFRPDGNFNPRSPSGLRRNRRFLSFSYGKFQSTQPEWAATLHKRYLCYQKWISIHAARVGCDKKQH